MPSRAASANIGLRRSSRPRPVRIFACSVWPGACPPYTGLSEARIQELFDAAAAKGRIEDLPVNHAPNFAPVIRPTLRTGIAAMLTPAGLWLADRKTSDHKQATEKRIPTTRSDGPTSAHDHWCQQRKRHHLWSEPSRAVADANCSAQSRDHQGLWLVCGERVTGEVQCSGAHWTAGQMV